MLARGGHPPSPSVFPRARSARNSAQACAHGVCVLGAQGGDLCQEGSTRWSSPPNRYLRVLCFGRRGTAASNPQSPAVGAAAGIPRLHLLLEPPSAATSFHIGVARAHWGAKPSTMVPPRASRSYKPVQGSTQWVAVTIWYRNIVCQCCQWPRRGNNGRPHLLVLHGVVALLTVSAGFSRVKPF